MKTVSKFLIVFTLTSLVGLAQKQTSRDSVYCMELRGKVIDPEKDNLPDCHVEVFDGLELVDSICIKDPVKKFTFFLKRDRSYALRISMKGYVSQLVSVNTDFPKEIDDVVPFSFNTILVSERKAEKLNRDALDFPIAIVYFDSVTESFVHNEEYTSDIKKQAGIPYKVSSAESVRHKSKKGTHTVLSVTY